MPTLPGLKMLPGMMPILQAPAVMTPGQLGPIRRDLEPASARLTLTMSITGMPSVMQMMSGISAWRASQSGAVGRGGPLLALPSVDPGRPRGNEVEGGFSRRAPLEEGAPGPGAAFWEAIQ